jgi:hypothetical protein
MPVAQGNANELIHDVRWKRCRGMIARELLGAGWPRQRRRMMSGYGWRKSSSRLSGI